MPVSSQNVMIVSEHGEEPNSLDYIEDPYFNPTVSTSTPSLDDLDGVEYLDESDDILENELELFDLRQLDFEDLNYSFSSINGNDESINVEAEFFNVKRANAIIRAFFRNKIKRQVRVTYCDLTKPYLAKLPKDSNFRKYLEISNGGKKNSSYGKSWHENINLKATSDSELCIIIIQLQKCEHAFSIYTNFIFLESVTYVHHIFLLAY